MSSYTLHEWDDLPIFQEARALRRVARAGCARPQFVTEPVASALHAVAERAQTRLRTPQAVLARTAKPSLRAGQVVGVVAAPGATLEILPKIDAEDGKVRTALIHMLAAAWDIHIAEGEIAALAKQRIDLLEILISLFSTRLLAAVRGGLPRRYIAHQEDLRKLRGKLDVTRQFTQLLMRPDLLACHFDELSENTPLNRVFKATVTLLRNRARTHANRRRLDELSARLEFVDESPAPLRESVRLDRTNTAFHELFQLARTFLQGDWQATNQGKSPGYALLFPMNDLFEKFIARTLIRAGLPATVRIQPKSEYALEGENGNRRFQLNPDLLVDGSVVIDTKWKELKPNERNFGVTQGDVYQMLAYANAYDAERLVLLYPWHARLGEAAKGVLHRWTVAGKPTPFHIATVDIGHPPGVAGALRQIIES